MMTPLAEATGVFGLAVSNTRLFFTVKSQGGGVYSVIKNQWNPAVAPFFEGEPYASHSIVAGPHVYWVVDGDKTCGKATGSVRRALAVEVANDVGTLAVEQYCPSNFVHHGGYVYWGSGTTIYRVEAK
jgi:hypothetical protein